VALRASGDRARSSRSKAGDAPTRPRARTLGCALELTRGSPRFIQCHFCWWRNTHERVLNGFYERLRVHARLSGPRGEVRHAQVAQKFIIISNVEVHGVFMHACISMYRSPVAGARSFKCVHVVCSQAWCGHARIRRLDDLVHVVVGRCRDDALDVVLSIESHLVDSARPGTYMHRSQTVAVQHGSRESRFVLNTGSER